MNTTSVLSKEYAVSKIKKFRWGMRNENNWNENTEMRSVTLRWEWWLMFSEWEIILKKEQVSSTRQRTIRYGEEQ